MKRFLKPRVGRRACGVYMITSSTGRVYVGASVNVGRRWSKHIWDLKNGAGGNPEMQRDYRTGCTTTALAERHRTGKKRLARRPV